MELRAILKLCQYGEHGHEWVRVPSGPGRRVLTGFVDVSFSKEPPALAALQPNYHAVYIPDASLTLAWGFPFEESLEERPGQLERADWQPETFKSVQQQAALVLYDGAMVWQATYAYADWGSGIGMAVPWPRPDFGDRDEEPTFWMTRWEVEFARLLSSIQREMEMDLIRQMTDKGVQVRDFDPITVEQERL